jgi:uncharacterized protein
MGIFQLRICTAEGRSEAMQHSKPKSKSESPADKAPAPESSAKTQEILHREEMLDEALEETFPASDPISLADPGSQRPKT